MFGIGISLMILSIIMFLGIFFIDHYLISPLCVILFFPVFVIGIGITENSDRYPGKKDVLSGKAEYVETIHIHKGDTTRTYEIEWKR